MPASLGFGAQLRRYRERAGLSQEALAERSQLTAAGIAALESGRRRRPYLDTLRRLTDALALSPEERAAFNTAARTADEPAAAVTAPRMPLTNIKTPRTRLIGREQAVAALAALVPAHPGRLVTLTGIGGAGKTRLALAVAAAVSGHFPDGVWQVELAALSEPALVPDAVAAALDLPELAGVALPDQLEAALRNRTLLLLLDNCEHVIDACSVLAERLLTECPGVRILATSREPLQIPGERQWRVLPLALPEPDGGGSLASLGAGAAVQLFVDRAQAVDAEFRLTEANAATVVELCTRLGGLPLAIELAAARVRVLSMAQICARLDDSLRLLSGNARALPTRHQTMRATLAWSYDLLLAPEQRLLRHLSVFMDGCDVEAAEAVASEEDLPADAVLDLLSGLVDKSLVLAEEEAGAMRFRLLEPIRLYAAGLLSADESQAVQARHAAWYTTLAERASPKLLGPEQLTWIARLRRELGNLRAALAWAGTRGQAETEARLAVALAPFFDGLTYLTDGRQALAAVLARPEGAVSPGLRRQALLAAGRSAPARGDPESAVALLSVCLEEARAAGDELLTMEALAYLGLAQAKGIGPAAGRALLEESLSLARALDDVHGIGRALFLLGSAAFLQANYAQARTWFEESLARYQQAGHLRYIALVQCALGIVMQLLGERREAVTLLREGMAGHLALGDRTFIGFRLQQEAAVVADTLPLRATRLLGAAEALRERLGATLVPIDRAGIEQTLTITHDRLSPAEFATAGEEGRALTLEQAAAAVVDDAEAFAKAAEKRRQPRARGAEPLTAREQAVAQLLAEGCTDREIAASLGMSVRTVGSHVQHLLAKLGLHSRWQVADRAQRLTDAGRPA